MPKVDQFLANRVQFVGDVHPDLGADLEESGRSQPSRNATVGRARLQLPGGFSRLEALGVEALYKRELGTRAFGLNT